MTLTLREYQKAAVNSFWRYFNDGGMGNPIIAMPTGTGKSLINAAIIHSAISAYPHTHILCLTHVQELIENNYKTLLKLWPDAPFGVYSAGLGRKDIHKQITFGGIGSVYKRAKLFQKTALILIDECHLVSDRESGMYLKFILALKELNPAVKVIGMSATPFRSGMGHLIDGKLFDEVCFDLTSG